MTTVLLVSDHIEARSSLRAALEEQRFSVLDTETRTGALHVLNREPVDLIAVDSQMADEEGRALCVRCKHDPRWRRIPFIFCTPAAPDPRDLALILRLGADGYIVQSTAPQEMAAQLDAILAGHGRQDDQAVSGALDDAAFYRMYSELLAHQLESTALELEQAQQTLAASDAMLNRSQALAHVGHWTWDTHTNRVAWSDEMFRIFGVDPAGFNDDLDEILRRTIHPDDLQSVTDANLAVVQAHQPAPMSYRVIWPDGSVRRLWADPVHRVLNAEGDIVQLSGIIQDITERSQANEELLHNLRRVAVASQAAGLGFWEYDILHDVEIWDDHMYALYGVRREDFEPTLAGWERWIHPQDLQRIASNEELALSSAKILHNRYRVVRPDGTIRHIEMYAEVERDANGKALRLVGVDRDVTESVESERRMQLQSAALSAAANAIVITALDGSVEWSNPAFTVLTGYTAEESIGRRLGDLLRSGLQDAPFYEQMWTSILHGQVWHGELVNRRKDGTLYTEEQAITPVLDNEGNVTHFVAIKQDISTRKQHEREMEAVIAVSSALRTVTTRAELLPVILEQLQVLFAADGAVIAMLDAKGEQLKAELGRGVWAPLTGAVVPPGTSISVEVLASGAPYLNNDIQHEQRILYPHLLAKMQAVAGAPLMAQGKVRGTLWISSRHALSEHDLRVLTAIADIAASALQRVELYERTQTQAEEMAQIMRSVPDGLLLLDAQYRVVTATPRAAHYLALVGGVGIGDTLTRLGERLLTELLTSPPAGQHHMVQAAERTFEVATRPVEAGPASSGWVLVIRDVTAELTAQQQLQRQERLAAIGQLAAGIAHDFNNIMSVITVYAQLLEAMPDLNDRARERLQIIDRQAMRATDMIRQILDFSRRSVIERQTFDLLPLLIEQSKLLERTLPENIEIGLAHSAGPFVVHADPTRLAQVIMNLSINARDAMPEGGKLTFELDTMATTSVKSTPLPNMGVGEWVRLEIADTGIGMAPAILQHIFEPFYTTKEPGHGTGLGLPQVHGIIGQHGGHIGVESQEGAGTRLTIYLPAIPVVTAEQPTAHAPSNLPHGHGEAILLVEDEPVLRESIADLLVLWSYRVVKAANGQEALDILAANAESVALVLTDVVMPVMGGIGLLKQMRQRGLKTPVVIITGHPLRDELEGLRQLGLAAWLNKPPSTTQLAHTLAQVLHG